jgi:WD40 repeat protein
MVAFRYVYALLLIKLASCGYATALVDTIPLPSLEGRIDHLSIDSANQRLYIAGLGNNSVEVVDLKAKKLLSSIKGFSEPQGVLFIPEINQFIVSNAGKGSCQFFDCTTHQMIEELTIGDDPDNIRYDAISCEIFVGYGKGHVAVIEPKTRKIKGLIDLPGHPEAFELADAESIYVNIPSSHQVIKIHRKDRTINGTYTLEDGCKNFAMAIDTTNHRLFVACRKTSKLLVFNTDSNAIVSTLELHEDCDDLFYDISHKLILATCGKGFLDTFSQINADKYALKDSLETASGARTGLLANGLLYLAVPHRNNQQSELRIYRP